MNFFKKYITAGTREVLVPFDWVDSERFWFDESSK